jgi:hypothetical protein
MSGQFGVLLTCRYVPCEAGFMTMTLVSRSARERMTMVLDAVACGLLPRPGCAECHHSAAGRCFRCAEALADTGSVNAAMGAVASAATDAEALAAYRACLLELAGAQQ